MDPEIRRMIDELINGVLHPDKEPVYEGWLAEQAQTLKDTLDDNVIRTPEQEALLAEAQRRRTAALQSQASDELDRRIEEAAPGKKGEKEICDELILSVVDEVCAEVAGQKR